MLCVGLISGTSLDGVDACIIEITTTGDVSLTYSINTLEFRTYPFPSGLKEQLLQLSVRGCVRDVCVWNVLLGKIFAEAARQVAQDAGIPLNTVSVIGSHGQTIWHQPEPQVLFGHTVSSTLQIGDPSTIACETGIATVGDFRLADMSLGGQGAPLVPFLDRILLRSHFANTGRLGLMLNIGGISNLTIWLPAQSSDEESPSERTDPATRKNERVLAFDCGPGNMVVDSLMESYFNLPYDSNGQIGMSGSLSQDLLDYLILSDDFLKRSPPKSTGRERYGVHYKEKLCEKARELDLQLADVVRTATEFTCEAVLQGYSSFIEPLLGHFKGELDLLVSGGGAKNPVIMQGLQRRFHRFRVCTSDAVGIDPDGKEAVCFALLAHETIHQRPSNVPEATGAREEVVLGKLCVPQSPVLPQGCPASQDLSHSACQSKNHS